MSTARTAYCYDAAERAHHQDGHPENRQRLAGTLRLLQSEGFLERLAAVPCTPIEHGRLRRVHAERLIESIEARAAAGGGQIDFDTYVNPGSYDAALLAAGGTTNLTLAVVDGTADNGMALVRPPGHHASGGSAAGFCLFNNVAVAARTAQAERGLARILIVDFDVHHGNGTQAIFYRDPGVFYFSTHQYPYYPGTGALGETGAGAGRGTTLNVPLPAGTGDRGYAAVWERILWPAARRYAPQLVLVSAGYDAHWDDPLAGERLSLAGYAHLVQGLRDMAQELCGGKLVFVLEGGYNLDVLAAGVRNTLHRLHDPEAAIFDPFGPAPGGERDISGLIDRVATTHDLKG